MKFRLKGNAKLLQDIFIHVGGDFLAKSIPFLLLPVLTKFLSSYDYGIVGNYQSSVAILTALIGLSSSAWLATEYYSGPAENRIDNLQYCFRFLILTGFLAGILVLISPNFLIETIGLTKGIVCFALFHAWCAAVISLVLSQFQVSKKALHFATLNFLIIAASTALSLFLIIYGKLGYLGRIYSFFVTFGIAAIYYLLKYTPLSGLQFKGAKEKFKSIIRFGLPLVPHELSSWISNYIDRVFLSALLSVSAAGIYTVVFQICYAYEALLVATNRGIVPYIYEDLNKLRSGDSGPEAIWRRIRILVGASTAIYLCGLLLGPFLFSIFIGSQFQQGRDVLPLLLTAFYLKTYYYLFVNFIFFSGKTLRLSSVTAVVALFQAGLSFILIKNFGLFGPAWAALAGSIITSGMVTWLGLKEIHKLSAKAKSV